MNDDEQWDRAEATLRTWRHQGRSFTQFMQTIADQHASPLHKRFQNLVAETRVWGGWADGQNGLWARLLDSVEQLYELWQQGAIVDEAMDTMGFPRRAQEDIDRIGELEEQDKQNKQIIEDGRRQDIIKDHRISALEKELKTWKHRALSESRRTQFGRRR